MKFADLHLHTQFSDGTFTPEELVDRANKLGFAAIALTDHDTVEGCARAAAACSAANMEFISGTELTAEHAATEVHILAYFVDTQNQMLLTRIAGFQSVRQNRIREMVAALNQLGIPLQAESVFALANCKSPGRPHVARALVKEKLIGSLDEAFERYLKKGRPGLGAQDENVRARSRRVDSSGRRARRDGASGFEPHGRNHPRTRGRRAGRHRMFSHETFDRDGRTLSRHCRQVSFARHRRF